MPRFVVLHHEFPTGHARSSHWDLMLEAAGALRTWALANEPQTGRQTIGERLPDHRLAYLDYEGPVSGDRGHVTRWDAGEYQLTADTAEQIAGTLAGQRLRGQLRMTRRDDHFWSVAFAAEPTTG